MLSPWSAWQQRSTPSVKNSTRSFRRTSRASSPRNERLYWLRFEWQHRGRTHVHGLAWLPGAPDVETLLSTSDDTELQAAKEEITRYADNLISTFNPAVLPDGSNLDDAPRPKTDPHVCNIPYTDVTDFDQDLADLVAIFQRHTRCSAAYCLRSKNGRQQCRFGYPKPLQATPLCWLRTNQ